MVTGNVTLFCMKYFCTNSRDGIKPIRILKNTNTRKDAVTGVIVRKKASPRDAISYWKHLSDKGLKMGQQF